MSDCQTYDLSMRRKVSLKMLRAIKNFKIVSAILESHSIDIDVTDSDGNTMLHWAAATQQTTFSDFKNKGANTNLRNRHNLCVIFFRPNLLMDNTGDNKKTKIYFFTPVIIRRHNQNSEVDVLVQCVTLLQKVIYFRMT